MIGSLRPLLTAAWTDLTSELLPVPRAPQSKALLAGKPFAKRSVLPCNISICCSIPRKSSRSRRLMLWTGIKRSGLVCQTYASAASRDCKGGGGGAIRSSASAIRCSRSLLFSEPVMVDIFSGESGADPTTPDRVVNARWARTIATRMLQTKSSTARLCPAVNSRGDKNTLPTKIKRL